MDRIFSKQKDAAKKVTSTKPIRNKNQSVTTTKGSNDSDKNRGSILNSFGEVSWENKIEAPTEEYWEWCCCACGKYQRTIILSENYKQEICKGVKGYECKHKRCEDCSEVRSMGVEETRAKEKAWAGSKEGKYYDKWCPE